MNKVAFGRRLYKVRKEKDLSSEAFSEQCGLNAVFIRQMENATRLPSLPVFVRLCNTAGVLPNYLLEDSLEWEETDRIKEVHRKLQALTPWQFELVMATIDTMIIKFEE